MIILKTLTVLLKNDNDNMYIKDIIKYLLFNDNDLIWKMLQRI